MTMRLFDFFYYSCLKNLKKYFHFEIQRIILKTRDKRLSRDNVGMLVPQIPGIGNRTGTQSHGIVETGAKICGTIAVLKSRGTTNPEISDCLA